MSFRRDKEQELEWKRWLQRNRDRLIACGLPPEAYEDRRNWWYFLDHATLWAPGRPHWFDVASLSAQQLRALHEFLLGDFPVERPVFVRDIVRNLLGLSAHLAANGSVQGDSE